jgi:Tfp pilus assembly protein PilF
MIVVEPAGAKFEVPDVSVSSDEHLLERISSAENRIARLADRLEKSLDLLLRQAQNSYFDRSLVKSLIDLLSDDGLVQPERLEKLWNERCQKDATDQEESIHRSTLRDAILAASIGTTSQEFQRLVNQGFLLIEDKKIIDGINTLRRAAELSTRNIPLHIFIGEHYFRAGKTKQAREYLSKAHEEDPQNAHITLLLGLTCADYGEAELAKTLLKEATVRGGSSFAAHCGLGWLLASERKWNQALIEFKQALDTRPSPEAHYILGAFYYQQDQDLPALRHLQKAVEMDSSYQEAYYLLALIHRRNGNIELANDALQRAAGPSSQPDVGAGAKSKRTKTTLLFTSSGKSRKLITGGDKRLAAVLRDDALHVFNRTAD